jgi:hypothetical protein
MASVSYLISKYDGHDGPCSGSSHQGSEATGLNISLYVLQKLLLAALVRDGVVDILPGED